MEPSFLTVMGPVGVLAFGIAFVMPSMMTESLAPFPHIAGAASARRLLPDGRRAGRLGGRRRDGRSRCWRSHTVLPAMTAIAVLTIFGLKRATTRMEQAAADRIIRPREPEE